MKKRKVKKILLIIIVIYLILFLLPKPQSVAGENTLMKDTEGRPLLIAHGGGNQEFPDNTLEAYYNAYSVDPNVMLETDVNLTKDGVVILSHDTTLDRKTNLVHTDIIDVNYSDLIADQVDFGYENQVTPSSNGYNESGTFSLYTNYLGENVTPLDVTYPSGVIARNNTVFLATTLEELIVDFPNNAINVEIKQSGDIGLNALSAVIDLMDQLDSSYHTYIRIVLVTFHKEVYAQMMELKKTTHPDLMLAPEQNGVIKFYAFFITGLSVFYHDPINVMQLPTEQYGINLSSKAFIRMANKHNIAVHYWTIDDADEMKRLIENGADGIMTDRPTLMKEVLIEVFG